MNKLFHRKKTRISIFDGIVECLLAEGWITSYDIKKLKQALESKFGNKIKVVLSSEKELQSNNFDYNIYSFTVLTKNDIKEELQKILDLFGYYVNKIRKNNKNNIYQIEPRYPIKINDILKQEKIKYFYHITPTKRLQKIKRIGLAPKGSKTTFYHSDDRIYLVSTNSKGAKQLKYLLVTDKKMSVDDFTVLKIPFNNRYQYYLDDMATFKNLGIIAVFVLKNIPPNEIEIVED